MKNIYKILLAGLFIFSTGIAKADFVDTTLAKEVATNYLIISGKSSNNMLLTLAYTEYVNNVPVHYVFDIDNTGHIIIAADDRVDPIRAYVPNGTHIMNTNNLTLAFPQWVCCP